tara:strand:+ start:3677 stop:4393 length:717 start_codon:yes stop_codon:yes gene_type:complete
MATTTAVLTVSGTGLVGSAFNVNASSVLTKAGNSTGIDQASGLSSKLTSSVDQYTIYKADDHTANKAHKVFLRNTSSTATEFFTVTIDDTILGRLYAGDFAFFPWAATDGIKQQFTCTLAATYASGDTIVFDGVTITAADANVTNIANLVSAARFPNWTATNADGVITFVAKSSNNLENVLLGDMAATTTGSLVATTAGNGTATNAQTVEPIANAGDIKITPSVATSMVLESMLIFEA